MKPGAVQARLAYLVVVGFFGLLVLLCTVTVPEANAAVLNVALGGCAAAFGGVVTYFFGSSAGSARKDQLLQDRAAPTVVPPVLPAA